MKVTKSDVGLTTTGVIVAIMGGLGYVVDQGDLDEIRELAETFPNPVTALIAVAGLAWAMWNRRAIAKNSDRIDRLEELTDGPVPDDAETRPSRVSTSSETDPEA